MATLRPTRLHGALSIVFSFLAALSVEASAQAAQSRHRHPPPRPTGVLVEPGIWHLDGNDPSAGDADLGALDAFVGNTGVVALGESIHTSGGFYKMKDRVIRYLVERLGFRAFAIENPWIDTLRLEQYVQTCDGGAAAGISRLFPVWQSTEVEDLAQWLCDWNHSHRKAADKVHVFGFDIQQPAALDAPPLEGFLGQVAPEAAPSWTSALEDCDGMRQFFYPNQAMPQDRYDRCHGALDDIVAFLETNRSALIRSTSSAEVDMARIHAVGMRAWQEETFYFAPNIRRALAARDFGMAFTFEVFRGLEHSGQRIALRAHNGHIDRKNLDGASVASMGSYLANDLGSDYKAIGLTAREVSIDWQGTGCGPYPQRLNNSVEDALHALGEPYLFVDLTFPGTSTPRLAPGRPYLLGDEPVVPREHWDGVIYLEQSPKMTPLAWPPCS